MPTPSSTSTELSWQAHPASERAGAAVLGGAVVLAVAAAAWWSGGGWAWSVLALAILTAALNRFFFRSRFAIDAEGITARFPLSTRRLGWRDVRRFVVDANGGYLSTRARRSWLDAYRGLHVMFGDQRDAVIECIRAHLPQEGRA